MRKFLSVFAVLLLLGAGLTAREALAFGDAGAGAAEMPEHELLAGIKVLDLESAKALALKWNPSVQIARNRLLQAHERLQQARSAWWPRVDGSLVASRVRNAPAVHQQNLQMARFFSSAQQGDNPANYVTAGLEVLWLLFDGFERSFAGEAAQLAVDTSQQAVREAQRQLVTSLGNVYFQALLAREEMAIAKADQQFNLRLLEEARLRLEAGSGSLSDMLNFEIRYNAAESNRIRARQAYSHARSLLAALLGLNDGRLPETLVLAQLNPETPAHLEPVDSRPLLVYAQQARPDMQQADIAIRQTGAIAGTARARFYPSLHLAGNLEARREGDAYFNADDFGNMVALKLTYNFLDGGLARARLAEARLQEAESRNAYRQVQNMLATEVMEAVEDVTTAQLQLKLQRANMLRVQQTRDLVEDEYKAGQSSLVRLNEAQRDLITAQSRLAVALVSLYQSRHQLDSVTGAILEPFSD